MNGLAKEEFAGNPTSLRLIAEYIMSITQELNDLLNHPSKVFQQPPSTPKRSNVINGMIIGVFLAVAMLIGTGNPWLSVNFGFGVFLVVGDILRFDDGRIGLTSGFLAALCASGVIGSFFGPEVGKVTAIGLFVTIAPAVHLMDTEPGWGRGGRNFFAVCWAVAMTVVFLTWFFNNYTLQFMG
jgi:hypothetical protein